nr:hypothetical protein [Tanacetum cinerariifolium]
MTRKDKNVRLVELCTLRTIVVLKEVSLTRSFVILIKYPICLNDPLQNCPKCGNPVDGQYCQGCALLRKKFKEDLFTYCLENGILQDASEPSNDDTNVVNALQDPFVVKQDPGKNSSQSPPQINHNCCYGCGDSLEDIFCHQCTCELCGKGAHYGYNFPPKFRLSLIRNLSTIKPLISSHKLFQVLIQHATLKMRIHSLMIPNLILFMILLTFLTHLRNLLCILVNFAGMMLKEEEKEIEEEQATKARYWKILVFYDDDDEDYTITITPKEPDNSLSMGDEHLDTISATESDEFIKSSVENLVPNLSEFEGEYECDVPACEDFTTFSNILFDADYDFSSNDDQSFSDEDIPKEIYSNPTFDEEIISMKIDLHHFNVEYDLIESLLNLDSLIISSSSKIDSLFDEFVGELTLLKSILPGINETDCDPEEEIHLIKRLFYDNSSPQIDLSFTPDDPMSPDIEKDDYDSERDIIILEELLSSDSLSLPKNKSFHFDIPSSSRPPAKPPDGNSGILNVKVMGDISKHKVPMPRLMFTQPTLVTNQEKSPNLLSHLGHETSQPSSECPMMIYGKNTPILDVLFFHFYPL